MPACTASALSCRRRATGATRWRASRCAGCRKADSRSRKIADDAAALQTLIAATARGDERAFKRLYDATSDVLFGVALRILRRRDWAEEVLQEAYVSVWRHAARYDRDKGAAMTWLIRIVRNQAYDWVAPARPDGFERQHAVSTEGLDETLPDGADLLAGIGLAESGARLADCLRGLDAPQRQSLALVYFHGLTHHDLAAHLRQPLGTVKAWVRRGLKRLRLCLGTS
jgi:RNA polymerase sigma-70 factor (ECF subfamily)